VSGPDCDDGDASRSPLLDDHDPMYVGNSIDNDCNGWEVCFADYDRDGWRPDATSTRESTDDTCSRGSSEASADTPIGDCDDHDASRNPGADERVASGADEDCDGLELCYDDADGDGYRTSGTHTSASLSCSGAHDGRATDGRDCCDLDDRAHPGQTAWFTTANHCGSFNYDCASGIDFRYSTAIGSCSTSWSGSSPSCSVSGGWLGSAPTCGSWGDYVTGCGSAPTCAETTTRRQQSCR
jgi:hypothetical protein